MHDSTTLEKKNYWQVLTSLVLEVQVISIGEEPGLQIETKKESLYFDYTQSFFDSTPDAAQ